MKSKNEIVDSGKKVCQITDVEYVGDYKLNLIFNDGLSGTIDLSFLFNDKNFNSLKDKKKFIQFGLEHGSLIWSNDLDVSSRFLHEKLFSHANTNYYSGFYP